MAISLRNKKLIRSLQLKKYRKEEQSFVVEGAKSVEELLRSDFEITFVAATALFLEKAVNLLGKRKIEVAEVTDSELAAVGTFESNQAALAIAKMKPNISPKLSPNDLVLVLDDIRDPGNLGTMIRTADWYGINHIIASPETADLYNAKTISATMGSFVRVSVYYTELTSFLKGAANVYGAFLSGSNVHTLDFSGGGFIVIGNESNGISEEVSMLVTEKINIPTFGRAESLNAGVAAAVILDNARRSKK